jgi:CysZ protein
MTPVRVVSRYASGVRLFGQGVARYARTPGVLALGLIPAALAALLFAAAGVALVILLPDLATAVTWFAGDWPEGARTAVRALAAIALLGLAALLAVLTFTAVTLLIGDPFYEAISRRVEGEVPEDVTVSFWRGLRDSLADSLRLLGMVPLFGVPLFMASFLPVVGQTVVPAVGATVGGWLLALQLTAVPFERRGLRLADRRRALRAHRPEALGFGTAVFFCFLIPGGAVLLMPAAVAGATLLARQVLAGPAAPMVDRGDGTEDPP